MKYPEKVTFEDLEKVSADVSLYRDVYEYIDDLLEGGERLKTKITQYLVKKPDEDDRVFSYRKKLFTYTPILPQCVSQLINRFTTGKFLVEGLKNGKNKIWDKIRADLDLAGTKEKEFVKQIFERVVRYKAVYAVVDYSEEAKRPFVLLLDPRHVVDYGETDGRLEWVKIRKLIEENPPIGEKQVYLEWTFIDSETIAVYKERVVQAQDGRYQPYQGRDGVNTVMLVRELLQGQRKGSEVSKEYEKPHNLGILPIVRLEIPDELWVLNQAIFLALEHIRVHNNMAYTATLAGQIQRLFTPIRETLEEVVDMEEARFQTGNERVLIGENFSFNETTGSALKTVGEYLTLVESKIKDLIFNTGVTTEGLSTADQSGASKSLDYVGQEKALSNYGERVAQFYERVLKVLAACEGASEREIEKITVLGLDEFSLDPLETKLERLQTLIELDIPISQTAMRLISTDIQQSMVGGVSNEERQAILEELEELYEDDDRADLEISYIQDFVLDRLISRTTARELLGFDPVEEENRINEEAVMEAERANQVNMVTAEGEAEVAEMFPPPPEEGAMPPAEGGVPTMPPEDDAAPETLEALEEALGFIDQLLDFSNPTLDEMETSDYEELIDLMINTVLEAVPPEEAEEMDGEIRDALEATEFRDEELNYLFDMISTLLGEEPEYEEEEMED